MNFTLRSSINLASLIQCFTQLESTTQQRKPFKDEWLGFSGQDARKSRFWKAHGHANKKDLLVRLSSLKDELAHGALMPLKPKNAIVRQIWEPEAKKIKL
ncbi:hypothetical protein [Vibrio rhizosphaerae]|uniref:hypothetical protein n=1 Tax=Vibrio rhizosphaerae TaxID=398736 RepID=UPI0021C2E575|nr:hypothetical protein [Vibrio rhizosphaerae]